MKRAMLLCTLMATTACGTGPRDPQAPSTPISIPVTVSPTSDATPPNFTVTGLATLDIAPNIVDVAITLEAQSPRPRRAVAELRRRQSALVKALEAAGLDGESLRTSTLSLEPITDWVDGRSRLRGYRASLHVIATTTEFERTAELMEAGATAGATAMQTHFRNTQIVQLKKRVRDMALAAAVDKAEQMATAIDVEVGRVLELSETPSGRAWSIYGGVENMRASAAEPSTATLAPSEYPLTLAVTIKYALDDPSQPSADAES